MLRVNQEEALRVAKLIILPSEEEVKLSVKEARDKITGMIMNRLIEGEGPEGDKYFDVFIVKHWVDSLQQLEDLIRSENLKDGDLVTMIYNQETDTYDVK